MDSLAKFFLQRVVGVQNRRKLTNDRMRSSRVVDEAYNRFWESDLAEHGYSV